MDLFSTNSLVGVVEDLRSRPAPVSLLSLFFPGLIEEATEEIHFDTEDKPRRLAPFVSPLSQGKVVENLGFATKTFKPAYVKDKRVFDANRPLKRMMGEKLTGSLSPEQRIQLHLVAALDDQLRMLRRRKEVMASEVLRTGSCVIAGDEYPSVTVNFGRAGALTKTLTAGAAEWDDAGINAIDNVEDWALEVLQTSGAAPTDVVFSVGAWRMFKRNPDGTIRADFTAAVDTLRARDQSSIDVGPRIGTGCIFRGTLGNLRLWTYADWYIDSAGAEQPIMPANSLIMGSASIEGVQCHGAIRDEEAGFQATEFWPKSWLQQDPSVRYLMSQSAPLVVPFRPNASLAAVVT